MFGPLFQYYSFILQILTLVVGSGIAIFAYSYTVRAGVRNAVNGVQAIEFDSYRVTPSVDSVRWRSPEQSTLKFVVHDIEEGRTPIDVERFVQEVGLQEVHGEVHRKTLQRELEECLGEDYDLEPAGIKEVNIYRSGINIPCRTAKPDLLQSVARAYRYYCVQTYQNQKEERELGEP